MLQEILRNKLLIEARCRSRMAGAGVKLYISIAILGKMIQTHIEPSNKVTKLKENATQRMRMEKEASNVYVCVGSVYVW